jgi:Lar family restriction alleviation protein
MSDLLKPCPFCGDDAHIERLGTGRVSMKIECDSCGATMETGETWIDENTQWNTRVHQSDWISVDDRLPEKCKHNDLSVCVLVYSEINKCIYTAVYDYLSRKFFHFSSLDELLRSESVRYWMPLPNPPEVK